MKSKENENKNHHYSNNLFAQRYSSCGSISTVVAIQELGEYAVHRVRKNC